MWQWFAIAELIAIILTSIFKDWLYETQIQVYDMDDMANLINQTHVSPSVVTPSTQIVHKKNGTGTWDQPMGMDNHHF